MFVKEYLELPKVDDYKIEVPKPCSYNWAIGIVAFVFVAVCGFCYCACRTEYFSWKSIVFSSVVIIVLAVMTFYLERALFVARKEKLAAYRELEKKQTAVYGKLLDAWLVEKQSKVLQANEQKIKTQEQSQAPETPQTETDTTNGSQDSKKCFLCKCSERVKSMLK